MPYNGLREDVKAKSGLAFRAFLLCALTQHVVWHPAYAWSITSKEPL
jgi:hypothetical protein